MEPDDGSSGRREARGRGDRGSARGTRAPAAHGRPEPGILSTFQSIALATLADEGRCALGRWPTGSALPMRPRRGRSTPRAARAGRAASRPGGRTRRDRGRDRGGRADVRRRRRRLVRLADQALGDLSPDRRGGWPRRRRPAGAAPAPGNATSAAVRRTRCAARQPIVQVSEPCRSAARSTSPRCSTEVRTCSWTRSS